MRIVSEVHRNAEGKTHENQREDFDPARFGTQSSHRIGELVEREWLGDSARRRESPFQVVESVRDSRIFHDVAFVENVRTSGRNEDVEEIGFVDRVESGRVDGEESRSGDGD